MYPFFKDFDKERMQGLESMSNFKKEENITDVINFLHLMLKSCCKIFT